jgi:ABC-2 type transport system ATP-binding protein
MRKTATRCISTSAPKLAVTAALSLSQVCLRYGARVALHEVSLEIPQGAAVALLGVNGAGKSTLLRAILDLVGIDSGTISIYQRSHREPSARRALAGLGEVFTPPRYATGREFLSLLCHLHGKDYHPEHAARECLALALDPTALARPAREYSKGMAQKLGLVACLLVAPPLLLLDEPMSGLDPQSHALFRARLQALQAAGTTLFFSTHALADVRVLCDRAVVIHAGAICFDDRLDILAPDGEIERAFLALLAHQANRASTSPRD